MDLSYAAIYLGLGMAVGGLISVLLERMAWIARRSSLAGVFIVLGRLTIVLGLGIALAGMMGKDSTLWWVAVVGLVVSLIVAIGMLLYAARATPTPAPVAAEPPAVPTAPGSTRKGRKGRQDEAEPVAPATGEPPVPYDQASETLSASPTAGQGEPDAGAPGGVSRP